jgi:hypothetical protein
MRLAVVHFEAKNCHAVNAKHERLQGRSDICQVACSFYDESLQAGGMCYLEQRVDVV